MRTEAPAPGNARIQRIVDQTADGVELRFDGRPTEALVLRTSRSKAPVGKDAATPVNANDPVIVMVFHGRFADHIRSNAVGSTLTIVYDEHLGENTDLGIGGPEAASLAIIGPVERYDVSPARTPDSSTTVPYKVAAGSLLVGEKTIPFRATVRKSSSWDPSRRPVDTSRSPSGSRPRPQ